ncbi:hypothetical protein [Streptomyces sp. CC224B]|uniref:hypothetical protein n=1 Tax=Streptomyces sp. CC224B TaxID=3044571 RepID=UPI0024A7B040|nr:hypothetical protein [Streptomyces sp. CC224B]
MSAAAGKFNVSLSSHALGFLAGTACLQGDEEPEVRAEIQALSIRKTGHAVGWVSFDTLAWIATYMNTWVTVLQDAEDDDEEATPAALRSAYAAQAKIGAMYAAARHARAEDQKATQVQDDAAAARVAAGDGTNEGGQVAGEKLKLKDVPGDVLIGAVPSADAIHALKPETEQGRWVPICPTRTKNPIRLWGPASEQNPALELCAGCSKLVHTAAVGTVEEAVEIPGLGRSVTRRVAKSATGSEENAGGDNVATTMNKAAQEAAATQVRDGIERLRSLIMEGKEEAAKELQGDLMESVNAITGRGAAGLKASLRAEVVKAAKEAKAAKKKANKAAKPKAEVATRATTDLAQVADLPRLYEVGATKIVSAAKQKLAAGTDVATVLVEIRSNITDVDGDPDLAVKQQITRDAASGLYDDLEKKLPPIGEDPEADVVREAVSTIKTDARRATRTVTVEYIRSLDVEPDPEADNYQERKDWLERERAKYANALDMFPEGFLVEDRDYLGRLILDADGNVGQRPIKWSERIFDYYEAKGKAIARTTRAEQYAEERRKKAERKAELQRAVEAGEISQEEADATLNAPAESTKDNDPIKRIKSAFSKQLAEVKRIKDEEEKVTRKDELITLLAEIRRELNSI